jgi:hypothetical protein
MKQKSFILLWIIPAKWADITRNISRKHNG